MGFLERDREMMTKDSLNHVGLNLSQEKQFFRGTWVSLRHKTQSF